MSNYWLRSEREALLRRLEIAVEAGAMEPTPAVESFRREAWQVNWFFRKHLWHSFDRLYNAGYYRAGLLCGFPEVVAARIGPEMRSERGRRGGEPLDRDDVAALLARLLWEEGSAR